MTIWCQIFYERASKACQLDAGLTTVRAPMHLLVETLRPAPERQLDEVKILLSFPGKRCLARRRREREVSLERGERR